MYRKRVKKLDFKQCIQAANSEISFFDNSLPTQSLKSNLPAEITDSNQKDENNECKRSSFSEIDKIRQRLKELKSGNLEKSRIECSTNKVLVKK